MNTGLRFITAEGRFNLSAIMTAAARNARVMVSNDWEYRIALRVALKSVWAQARGECAIHDARTLRNVTIMREVARDTYLPVTRITR